MCLLIVLNMQLRSIAHFIFSANCLPIFYRRSYAWIWHSSETTVSLIVLLSKQIQTTHRHTRLHICKLHTKCVMAFAPINCIHQPLHFHAEPRHLSRQITQNMFIKCLYQKVQCLMIRHAFGGMRWRVGNQLCADYRGKRKKYSNQVHNDDESYRISKKCVFRSRQIFRLVSFQANSNTLFPLSFNWLSMVKP